MSASVAGPVLARLKDFQRATVDYVFDRLYLEPASSGRFLVADEVGLGKTMIAKGVIAKAIDHLYETVPRIDVVYICSNGDIARQNINRLHVGDARHIPLVSRLTLLPRELPKLIGNKVNFISFTPSTSFELNDGLGKVDERVLLYALLRELWGLGASKPAMNVLQGNVRRADRFRDLVVASEASGEKLDPTMLADFGKALEGQPDLRARFDALCTAYARSNSVVSDEVSAERSRVVGEMRAALAASCVNALEPDLVILDEFQRFGHLLAGDDENDAARLARALFNYKDVRVLLLSATPYKMYTTVDEAGGEDHYADFVRTLRFLERAETSASSVESTVAAYRDALVRLGDAGAAERVRACRQELEGRLRRVMVRTERLASTSDRNGMLHEMPRPNLDVVADDLHRYLAVQKIARDVEAEDTLELWKSTPFVLSFADEAYKLGRKVREAVEDGDARQRLARTMASTSNVVFPWSDAEDYRAIESGNARTRALVGDVIESGAYKLLWVPPSLPYYRLGGAFAEPSLATFTKRLVFSAWRMVPRAIAGLVSYEAERRMFEGDPEARNTVEARRRRRPLLVFSVSDGRLGGMPLLSLLYPSVFLALACDPAVLLRERAQERSADDAPPSVERIGLEEVLAIAQERVELGLRRLKGVAQEGHEDERWYWAAPLLLDKMLEPKATEAWFAQPDLAAIWSGVDPRAKDAEEEDEGRTTYRPPPEEGEGWRKHVEVARQVATEGMSAALEGGPLGMMPRDLVQVLAELAVAGPAVSMFRALDRVVRGDEPPSLATGVILRNGAGRAAWSFRSLFNHPEVISMLRGGARGATETGYWRTVLRYCAEGCLPAVLDEYVHILRDQLGVTNLALDEQVRNMAEEIRDAVELRTSRVGLDHYPLSASGRTIEGRESRNLRTHFALRFGDDRAGDDGLETRANNIRKAFNSPFWPFVLASTSVGQEGLDFHNYCHAVVHWNMPSNPVDLEQREGRVHRYKGHAVRRNVARTHGWAAIQGEARDHWTNMFDLARAEAKAKGASEIVPYWVYPVEGGARIERHVFALPLSREHAQAERLRSSLAVYRMVFGQPRQEDLVRHLVARLGHDEIEAIARETTIDLSPPNSPEVASLT